MKLGDLCTVHQCDPPLYLCLTKGEAIDAAFSRHWLCELYGRIGEHGRQILWRISLLDRADLI